MTDYKKAFMDTACEINVLDIREAIAKKVTKIRAEYKGFKAMDALKLMNYKYKSTNRLNS